jgi:hypothetical protein
MRNENRFRALERLGPDAYRQALVEAQAEAARRYELYRYLAGYGATTEGRP